MRTRTSVLVTAWLLCAVAVGHAQEQKGVPKIESPVITTNGVTFSYYDPKAFAISVTGEFNQWNINSHLLEPSSNGVWTITTKIKPGTYKYEFNINGIYWKHDPNNPNKIVDRFGSYKSIVEVPETVPAATTHDGPKMVTFTYSDANAKEVAIGSTFNSWNPKANPMTRTGKNLWSAKVELKPGIYPYKFWVDGKWINDPANPSTLPDSQGGTNSVVKVGE
jgi:1,4-alpha-glucan branching enzyme